MDKWQKKCRAACRELVMGVGVCEACRIKSWGLQQHHGLMKSSQRYKLNPLYWYDPSLQFCLCADCHEYETWAPHVSQNEFEHVMIPHANEKIQTLRALRQGPLIRIDARTIDWEKMHASLVEHGRPLGNEIYQELTT